MSPSHVSMASPFRWLSRALDVGRRHPQALFGGFALLLGIGLLPSVLQAVFQQVLKPDPDGLMILIAVFTLIGALLLPPLLGGAFRLLHACESGGEARAQDVLALYRDPPMALRMVLTAVLMLGLYALVLGALWRSPGGEFFAGIMKIAMATPPGTEPDISGLVVPQGLLLWLLAAVFALIVLGNTYMLAFAQAALGDRGAAAAVGDGLVASLKNLLPFIGIFLAMTIGGFVLMLVAALALGLAFGVLHLISPALAVALAVPLYFAVMLLLYVVMFGYYYHAWREIFGGGQPPALVAELVV